MMKPTMRVMSFGKGAWYGRGLERLSKSLMDVQWKGHTCLYTEEDQIGCKPHSEIPYGFKVACFRKAQAEGAELVLWVDAAIYAVKPLAALFRCIEEVGYFFVSSCLPGEDHTIGKWTNDRMLKYFGVEHDNPVCWTEQQSGCIIGLDLRTVQARNWLNQWEAAVPYFPGDWKDHRHDQAAAALISARAGMFLHPRDNKFFAYRDNRPLESFASSVCLISEGM